MMAAIRIIAIPAGQEIIEGWYGGPRIPDADFNGEFVSPVGRVLRISALLIGFTRPGFWSCKPVRHLNSGLLPFRNIKVGNRPFKNLGRHRNGF